MEAAMGVGSGAGVCFIGDLIAGKYTYDLPVITAIGIRCPPLKVNCAFPLVQLGDLI